MGKSNFDHPWPPPPPHDYSDHEVRSQLGSCTKLASTLLPVCSSGWPTTICRNLCSPSRRCSITSSENRFVNTLPGSGGMVTRDDSRSRMSRKCSKSLYRRRTLENLSCRNRLASVSGQIGKGRAAWRRAYLEGGNVCLQWRDDDMPSQRTSTSISGYHDQPTRQTIS